MTPPDIPIPPEALQKAWETYLLQGCGPNAFEAACLALIENWPDKWPEWRYVKDAPQDETPVIWLLRNGEVIIGPGLLSQASIQERTQIYKTTGKWPQFSGYEPVRWMPRPPPHGEHK